MLVIIRQLLYGIWIIQINIKTIFKRILKYTLGASCKDCTDSTSCKSDIFKCTGSEFFLFWNSAGVVWVWVSGHSNDRNDQGAPGLLIRGLWCLAEVCSWLSCSGTAGGRHNLCTSTPWATAEPAAGRAVRPHRTQRSLGYWEIRFLYSFEMLICLSKKGFSFLWKSNTWIYWICVLTVCYTIQYFKLRHVTFMAEAWRSKWPCCTRSWWGWCESGFWNHCPGQSNLYNTEVLPLWMTPFLKLFCWVFLKLTYHCGCQIQKLKVKLSQTSTDQIQTTTLALFV